MDRKKKNSSKSGGKINAMLLDDGNDNKGYVIPAISNQRKAKDTAPILSLYKGEVFNTAATDLGVGGSSRAMLRNHISKMLLDSTQATKAQKASSHASGYSSSIQDFEGSAMTLLKKLQRERMILSRLGFSEKAEKLDVEIERVRKAAMKQREAEFDKLYNEHISVLEKKQERRADRLEAVLRAKKKILDTEIQQEYDNLLRAHEEEFLNLYDNTERKAIGKVSKCNCPNTYVCQHNKSSSYNTRKSKPQVVLYKNSSKRLKQGGRSDDAVQLMELATSIDYEDQDEWRKRVSTSITQSPWGANVSVIDRMIDDHKKQIEAVKEAHRCKLKAYEVSANRRRVAVKNIETSERSRLRTKCRKIYEKMLTERASKDKDAEGEGSDCSDDVEGLPPLPCTGEDENTKTDDDKTDNDDHFDDCNFGDDSDVDFDSKEYSDNFVENASLRSPSLLATPYFDYKEPVSQNVSRLNDMKLDLESLDLSSSISRINSTLSDVGRLKSGLISIGKNKSHQPKATVAASPPEPYVAVTQRQLPPPEANSSVDGSVDASSHDDISPPHSTPEDDIDYVPHDPASALASPKSNLKKSVKSFDSIQQLQATPSAKQPSRSVSFSFEQENTNVSPAVKSSLQPTPPGQIKSSTSSPNSSTLSHRRGNSINEGANEPGSLRDEDWVERERAIGNGYENSYGVSNDDVDAAVSSLVRQLNV